MGIFKSVEKKWYISVLAVLAIMTGVGVSWVYAAPEPMPLDLMDRQGQAINGLENADNRSYEPVEVPAVNAPTGAPGVGRQPVPTFNGLNVTGPIVSGDTGGAKPLMFYDDAIIYGVTDIRGGLTNSGYPLEPGASNGGGPLIPVMMNGNGINDPFPTGTVNNRYVSADGLGIAAIGGTSPYTYTTDLNMNIGLRIVNHNNELNWCQVSRNCINIVGTPTMYGTWTVTVTVTDARNRTGSITKKLTINPAPIAIAGGPAGAALPNGTVGQAYAPITFTSSGGIGPRIFRIDPALPAGLTLNSDTGVLSGTPSATVNGNFVITASDSSRPQLTTTVNYTLAVNNPAPVAIGGGPAGAALPSGTVGQAYAPITFTANGGIGAKTFSVAPALPAGLTLNNATGVLGGTPSARVNGNFVITASDSSNPPLTTTVSYTLAINNPLVVSRAANTPAGANIAPGVAGNVAKLDIFAQPGSDVNITRITITRTDINPGVGSSPIAIHLKDAMSNAAIASNIQPAVANTATYVINLNLTIPANTTKHLLIQAVSGANMGRTFNMGIAGAASIVGTFVTGNQALSASNITGAFPIRGNNFTTAMPVVAVEDGIFDRFVSMLDGLFGVETANAQADAGRWNPVAIYDDLYVAGSGSSYEPGNITIKGAIRNEDATPLMIADSLNVTGDLNSNNLNVSNGIIIGGSIRNSSAYPLEIDDNMIINDSLIVKNAIAGDNFEAALKVGGLGGLTVESLGGLNLSSTIQNPYMLGGSGAPLTIADDLVVTGTLNAGGADIASIQLTATSISLLGTVSVTTLNVSGNLTLNGAASTLSIPNGSVTAKSIGKFYTSELTANMPAGGGTISSRSHCASGDMVIGCYGYISNSLSTFQGSKINANSCLATGNGAAGGILAQAVCFNPDGSALPNPLQGEVFTESVPVR